MPKARTKKKKPQDRVIPMVWDFPEDLWSGYATNILVQTGEEELYVSFFEARPPVILNKTDWEKVESVTAQCIARIVITPDRLAKFIDAMQQQLVAFNKKKAAKQSDGTK